MTDWFVYQHDLYVNDFDPNSLGLSLQPQYDACKNVIYRDDRTNNNGLRRVQSYWGVDPLIVQLDIVLQIQARPRNGLPPLHSRSQIAQTTHWTPAHQQFHFTNTGSGFHFENINMQQCVVVTRDSDNRTSAKLMQKDNQQQYTITIGEVLLIRRHKLTQLTPPALNTSTFSKFVTAHLNVGNHHNSDTSMSNANTL